MHKPKFTDQQFLEQYNKGLNDVEISYIFNVHDNTVMRRRWKLNLLPNWRITTQTITNPKQHLKKVHQSEVKFTLRWKHNNRPTVNRQAREQHQRHKESHNAHSRNRYQKNIEKYQQYDRQYRAKHKDKESYKNYIQGYKQALKKGTKPLPHYTLEQKKERESYEQYVRRYKQFLKTKNTTTLT